MNTHPWTPNSKIWHNLRVLVTGHTGFMGGWLVVLLNQLGATVNGLALPAPTSPSFYEVVGVRRLLAREIIGDVRDGALVKRAILDFQPQVVFHLAAQPLVGNAFLQPVETFQTNVLGTVNVLDALRFCSDVEAAIVVTSDKVYQKSAEDHAFNESDSLGGAEPYGGSKACAEIVVDSYRRSYFAALGIRVATIRAGNVIGGGDWAPDRLVPDIVRAFSSGSGLCVRHPGAIRPWQHVAEPLRGYLMLAERMLQGSKESSAVFDGPWNFGPPAQDHKTVAWIVDHCAALWGASQSRTEQAETNYRETHRLSLSSQKAETLLGWKPFLDLAASLEYTIAWYRSHLQGASMLPETINQISEISSGCLSGRAEIAC